MAPTDAPVPPAGSGDDHRPPVLLPMLAGGRSVPPDAAGDRDAWLWEVKWDGIRVIATCAGGSVRLTSRLGNDVTTAWPELEGMGPQLAGHEAILDGEIVAMGPDGLPSFALLQRRMHVHDPGTDLVAEVPVVYCIFDVLRLDGTSLLDTPLHERRRILEGLGLAGPAWQVPPLLTGDVGTFVAACRESGLEGVIAKRVTSRYRPGRRSDDWCKVRFWNSQELVVGGWQPARGGTGPGIGSLLVGAYDLRRGEALARGVPQRLRYVGKVGSGLTADLIAALHARLDEASRDTPAFDPVPDVPAARWLQPWIVVEVTYQNLTDAGMLRFPVFKGLRPDKDPRDVVLEETASRESPGVT